MINCVRTDSNEFIELLEATKLPSLLLEMRISKWQEVNGLENYPTIEDINKDFIDNNINFDSLLGSKTEQLNFFE